MKTNSNAMSNHFTKVNGLTREKAKFPNVKLAQKMAFKMSRKFSCEMSFYRCPICNEYHIGRKPGEKK